MGSPGALGTIGILLGSPVLQQCSIDVVDVEGDQVTVTYGGLPGNQPKTYKDYIGIWAGSLIAPNVPPIGSTTVAYDEETGSAVVQNLTIAETSYTAGYALGDGNANVCASQLIGAGGQLGTPKAVGMSINSVTANVISLAWQGLPGSQPATAGSWVGLWKGEIDPYDPGTPVTKANVPRDTSQGDMALVTQMAIKTDYTLVFFMSANTTTAAAMLTFTTA